MGDHGVPPEGEVVKSAFGFRNIRAKTRGERRGMRDKVALERSRLMERSGWQARMHQKNAPETTAGLTSCRAGDEGYLSNAERFHSDTAGEEYAERMKDATKRQQSSVFKREKARVREEARWENTERAQSEVEQRMQVLRENPDSDGIYRGAKKNLSNVAYDITNLQYKQDTAGEGQKYFDDMVRYRAQQRTRALVVLGDSRVPYNILNGDDRSLPPKPNTVVRPSCLDDPDLVGGNAMQGVDRRRAEGATPRLV